MKIPFIDLNALSLSIKTEIHDAIEKVISTAAFSSGPYVEAFEINFAGIHGAKYCVAVNSGTAALHIAMWASGLERDDEVIVPTNTFFATPEAVSLCNAKPVFIDCDPDYQNIDVREIGYAIGNKTRAIIAVHLYGQPAQMEEIRKIAEKNSLLLFEDCAQAHLAEYKGQPVGTFGAAGCFSFYPSKNLGAYGEGGAVITNDETLYWKMRALRDHGSFEKYYHDCVGHNYRMEGIQGAVLDVKLKYLASWNNKRRENANLYKKYLEDVSEVELPMEMPEAKHVYHLFVTCATRRDELKEYLQDNGVSTGIHYPVPCHLQRAYEYLGHSIGSFPVSEKCAEEILSLPMYAELSASQIRYVCDKIKEFYKQC